MIYGETSMCPLACDGIKIMYLTLSQKVNPFTESLRYDSPLEKAHHKSRTVLWILETNWGRHCQSRLSAESEHTESGISSPT